MQRSATTERRQGACLQCKKLKRKCDQKHPRCTQCKKKLQDCSLQVFKIKTIQNSQPSSTRRRTARRLRNSENSLSTHTGQAPVTPATPVEDVEPRIESSSLQFLSSHDQDVSWSPLWCPNSHSDTEAPNSDRWFEILSGRTSDQNTALCIGPTTESVSIYIETVPDGISGFGFPGRSTSHAPVGGLNLLQLSQTCTQMPSELLNSTVRRLLWDYFVNRASQVFLCWEPDDAQLDKRYSDPYTENLPAIAVESGPMMLASLALSAFHYAGGGRSREDHELITSLMLEASHALAASRWQGPQNFKQLLATVGAASFLYLLKPDSYSDMLPLSRSAALCLMTNPKWQNVNEPSYQAVMQIFRWSDICAQCSMKRFVPIPDEHMQLRLELRENERAASLSSGYADWHVHPLYAFAEDLISPLRRIAWLIRLRLQGCVIPAGRAAESLDRPQDDVEVEPVGDNNSDAFRIPSDRFEALVEDAERTIDSASAKVRFAKDRHQHQQPPRHQDNNAAPDLRTDLNRLATAMYSTIVILFSTRLRDIPWTTALIRTHVQNVAENLCSISASSRFSNGVVFPLYVAGLEAVDANHRSMIINSLKHLPGIWSKRETQLVACLEHVWALRDEDPGAVWISWIHKVSTDCEDFIPA